MTLHVSRISKLCVIQVSDRLVSAGGRPIDSLANKNVIYQARDAIVAIGYSGVAHMPSASGRQIPTDSWIVDVLYGREVSQGPDGRGPATFSTVKMERWLDIGQAVRLLRDQLDQRLAKLPRAAKKHAFEIVVVGWQRSKRRWNPLMVNIFKAAAEKPSVVQRPRRRWHLGGDVYYSATPDNYLKESDLEQLAARVRGANLDGTENGMVQAVRNVAYRCPNRVGPHCIAISLPPPQRHPARVRFLPAVEHTAVFETREVSRELPVAYSPWVIGPSGYAAPSMMVGSQTVRVGDHEIHLEGPSPPGAGIKSYLGGAHRPPM